MKDIESVGLQKFDFLGLRTLTIIKDALDLINTKREKLNLESIDLDQIDLEDRITFDLLQSGLTTCRKTTLQKIKCYSIFKIYLV